MTLIDVHYVLHLIFRCSESLKRLRWPNGTECLVAVVRLLALCSTNRALKPKTCFIAKYVITSSQ